MTEQYWPYVVIVIVLVLGFGYLRWWFHRKKTNAFKTLAQQHGWTYVEHDSEDLPYRFRGEPFERGDSRYAQNIMVGGYRGYQMAAFDYTYVVVSGSGQNRSTTTYQNSVVALGTPRYRPILQVQKEKLGNKLLGMVGVRDLQLESIEFNKTFLIQSESDRFAYDILHPRMMEWMLADERTRHMPFRFEGTNLLIWQEGTLRPEAVTYLLDYASDILDRVPAFVWND